MPSVVFVFILLVVMVTNDVTAVNEQLSVEPTSQNDTDVINSTDASNDTDDVIVPSTDAEVQPPNKAEDAVVQCSITPEQYDNLNEKLTELELQLEILQSSVDRIGVSSSTKTISGGMLCRQNCSCAISHAAGRSLSAVKLFPCMRRPGQNNVTFTKVNTSRYYDGYNT